MAHLFLSILVHSKALVRVVLVFPDCEDLLRREGVRAEPVKLGQDAEDIRDMVYLYNVIYPAWVHDCPYP